MTRRVRKKIPRRYLRCLYILRYRSRNLNYISQIYSVPMVFHKKKTIIHDFGYLVDAIEKYQPNLNKCFIVME